MERSVCYSLIHYCECVYRIFSVDFYELGTQVCEKHIRIVGLQFNPITIDYWLVIETESLIVFEKI